VVLDHGTQTRLDQLCQRRPLATCDSATATSTDRSSIRRSTRWLNHLSSNTEVWWS
jgi:hypothetical protein